MKYFGCGGGGGDGGGELWRCGLGGWLGGWWRSLEANHIPNQQENVLGEGMDAQK